MTSQRTHTHPSAHLDSNPAPYAFFAPFCKQIPNSTLGGGPVREALGELLCLSQARTTPHHLARRLLPPA